MRGIRKQSWIGFLNDLFYDWSYIAGLGRVVNFRLCLMKNPLLCRAARPERGREASESCFPQENYRNGRFVTKVAQKSCGSFEI